MFTSIGSTLELTFASIAEGLVSVIRNNPTLTLKLILYLLNRKID